jgi:CheY-like chemotaxis protein
MTVRVLLVDDSLADRLAVRRALERDPEARWEVEQAITAEEALAYLRQSPPDVLLMDVNLPGMSGIAALRALRADPATAAIPVLALTANAMPRDVERGLASGFNLYLTKPIDIDEFTAAIDSTLARLAQPGAAQETVSP